MSTNTPGEPASAAHVAHSGHAPVASPGGKSKTTAVVLAVFLSFWTWLYTYKTDAWKFWVGLAVWLLIALPLTFAYGVGFLFTLGINIWAIIDASVKPREYYTGYGAPKQPTSY
jgi:hypothetical protein